MITSKNPYSGEKISTIEEFTTEQINRAIDDADDRFKSWRKTSFEKRSNLMLQAAKELRENSREYAETITAEMGKPITQSLAEVEKCAWVCEYYAKNAEAHLASENIETDAAKSYVAYEPIGVVLAIMPWNYPFWQVFRFAAPALMAGNIGVLKHASNVMQSAGNIQKVFERAGFPKGCFQNLPIGSDKVEEVIKNKHIKAVTLTGSTPAGSAVASTAGKEIKKSVLELGGSNALVVLEDANLQKAAETCVQARFQNTGQSCIAGKRLLLHQAIAEDFLKIFLKMVKELKSGDPMDKETFIGVLAREDLAEDLEEQVNNSIKAGAKLLLGR
jgi:succinate-semialdehyde dehydrogenase / glutarate-semialdehyde dehydrogenase